MRRLSALLLVVLLAVLVIDWTAQARAHPAHQQTSPTATPSLFVMPTLPPSPTPICSAAPLNRLILHQRGQVTNDDPSPLNLRDGPGTNFAILGTLDAGAIFWVISGPRCSQYSWYRVEYNRKVGWIAEGDPFGYYVEPYFPG